jgi:hypothetical protein
MNVGNLLAKSKETATAAAAASSEASAIGKAVDQIRACAS